MSRNFLSKPPIQRHGVSTEDKPLQKIPVNTEYELEPELLDELYDLPMGNSCAPFPYQLSVFDNHIDIYSGDGRIVATVMRDNFKSFREFIFTARLMAYSYVFYDVAGYAMGYIEMLRAGSPSSYPEKYGDKVKEFYPASRALTYSGVWGGDEIYEPVRYSAKGYETETEMAYGDDARVARDTTSTDALIKDHELPEISEEAYNNGYA